MSFFEELKRRNVVKMAALYAVASWLILQIADVLFDALELPSTWARLILAILILGFPLVLIFAWVYEMTPEGLKRENDVNRSQSVTHTTGRKINTLIVVLLVLAIATVVVDRLMPETTVADAPAIDSPEDATATGLPSDKSIAVLPFDNRSNRDEDQYFTDGIHDDLLTTIANIGSMKVISRTSVMEYRGTTKKIPQIAKELGVATILEGGIQRSGNKVRINVQLIDAATDQHLWAETYDRELTTENLFAIQSEVSSAIASALQATLSPEEQQRIASVPTENLEAYEAYLLGRERWRARTAESTNESVGLFLKAVEIDPDFALAWVGLSDAYRHQAAYSGFSADEVFPKAERAVLRAIELDNRLGEAYATLGGLRGQQGDRVAAETAFKRAIKLNPNYAPTYNWYSLLIGSKGEPERALEMLTKGLELDPRSIVLRSNLGHNYSRVGQFDKSRETFEQIIDTYPESPSGPAGIAIYHATVRGRLDEALPWSEKAIDLDPEGLTDVVGLSFYLTDLGDTDGAQSWLDRIDDLHTETRRFDYGMWYLSLRHNDAASALKYARRVVEQAQSLRIVSPDLLATLRDDDLAQGRASVSLARYQTACPEIFDAEPAINQSNFVPALDIAYLLLEMGRESEAQAILDRVITVSDSIPLLGQSGTFVGNAPAYALMGRKTEALSEIRRGVDAGWRTYWWFYFDHYKPLESLRDEPEFKAMRAEVEADMAEQLARVQATKADRNLSLPK